MSVTGVIVEYNPFHNGHIYHLQQARSKTNCDVLIAVMSGHFTQRGEPSVIDKWTRTRFALEYGVDLVIELPFNYATQSADYFASGALTLLNALGIDTLVYGSESNNADELCQIAQTITHQQDSYDQLVKEAMNQGERYPTACNQALSVLLNKEIRLPNDLLAFSYIKEIIQQHYPIQPVSIARTNDFHSVSLNGKISSATSIRQALKDHTDISQTTPMAKELEKNPILLEDFYDLLYYELISNPHLDQYHLVDEGIDKLMTKKIMTATSMEDFISSLTSKRYTQARIQRTILSILINQPKGLYPIDYIRVLGMTAAGQGYLNQIKKKTPIPIISNFSSCQSPLLDLELKATKLYACALPLKKRLAFIEKEYKGKPIRI
ncbi:nucleotidyltransferase [Beduini massiliensis]|uniref:nucleotidyltransferase n=1 Tax=Beduini massiliensis TaxID=1585974 RepID=UPI00059A9B4A|nr:nucleotidyltransferase [Beduini massiliensis]